MLRFRLVLLSLLALASLPSFSLEVEMGGGATHSRHDLVDNNRLYSVGITNSVHTGLQYGVSLGGSDRNDGGLSQRSLMATVGYRQGLDGGLYLLPRVGVGRASYDLATSAPTTGVTYKDGTLSLVSLTTGYEWRTVSVGLEAASAWSNGKLQNPNASALLNKTGINNLVYNPFGSPTTAPDKIGHTTSISILTHWHF